MNYFKVFMDIDEQLLGQNESEKAGQFRAAKRLLGPEDSVREGASFREQLKAKKFSTNTETGVKGLISQANPFRKMTDGWLKGAWQNLIPSWGLTLLYIDAHAFLNKVFGPKYFRELGGEWVPVGVKKLEGAGLDKAASMAKVIEPIGCACLNLAVLFLILLIITIITIIASIITGDLALIWDLFKEALGELKNLFS